MVRNQHGFIILDEAIEIENNLVNKGRKPKTWLLFENEEYLEIPSDVVPFEQNNVKLKWQNMILEYIKENMV